MSMNLEAWWKADDDKTHTLVVDYVAAVERNQFDLFNKFARLEAMYDPNAPGQRGQLMAPSGSQLSNVIENVIASNIDTVTAVVAATEIRARFQTDDADWSTQRQAKHLEWYADGLSAAYDVDDKCQSAFRDAALKGTGLLKIYADEDGEIHVELVQVDDIVVDEAEARNGKPKQLHQRLLIDREELKAQFPGYETEIDNAQVRGPSRLWAGFRPVANNECVALESWRLPIGKSRMVENKKTGKLEETNDGYVPGRHSITVDGCDLLDEKWHKGFPFVRIVWSKRNGWYGIGLAERIAGIQNALNKRNWQIDRLLNQAAAPTTYVSMADANLVVKTETTNRATIVPHKGPVPTTPIVPIVNPETYQSRRELKESSFEESGVSRMTAQAAKPAGIDSGVAMREYKDQTTQRFALQERAFQTLKLDVILALIAVCKELGDKAPAMVKRSKFGRRTIEWSEVDMGEIKVQIAAASVLSKTPAGRSQTVLEWAQAGIITQDAARRLMDHPDLEREMSLMTAALESVEYCIERILDGEQVTPEPFMNLDLCVSRAQLEYLKIATENAPEEVLENLRGFIVQAAYRPPAPANQNAPAMPGAIGAIGGAIPGAPDPNAMPALQAMPGGGVPQAALSAQAMQLRSV